MFDILQNCWGQWAEAIASTAKILVIGGKKFSIFKRNEIISTVFVNSEHYLNDYYLNTTWTILTKWNASQKIKWDNQVIEFFYISAECNKERFQLLNSTYIWN